MNNLGYILMSMITFITCQSILKKKIQKERQKVQICVANWIYQDYKDTSSIIVLYFKNKSSFDLCVYPNFIIGIDRNHDTIGIVDKNYNNIIRLRSIIKFGPSDWTAIDKSTLKPLFIVYNNSEINDLFCSVETIYYTHLIE